MQIVSLLAFLALVGLAAAMGAQFMPGEWYAALAKPAWTPPNSVFPIAWTALYIMIALAGWLIWSRQGVGKVMVIWAVGLGLNALWSYLMFGLHDIALAFVDIAMLWVSIAGFIWAAWPVDRRAAYLFVPYFAWVSFAAALNAAIFAMNGS